MPYFDPRVLKFLEKALKVLLLWLFGYLFEALALTLDPNSYWDLFVHVFLGTAVLILLLIQFKLFESPKHLVLVLILSLCHVTIVFVKKTAEYWLLYSGYDWLRISLYSVIQMVTDITAFTIVYLIGLIIVSGFKS